MSTVFAHRRRDPSSARAERSSRTTKPTGIVARLATILYTQIAAAVASASPGTSGRSSSRLRRVLAGGVGAMFAALGRGAAVRRVHLDARRLDLRLVLKFALWRTTEGRKTFRSVRARTPASTSTTARAPGATRAAPCAGLRRRRLASRRAFASRLAVVFQCLTRSKCDGPMPHAGPRAEDVSVLDSGRRDGGGRRDPTRRITTRRRRGRGHGLLHRAHTTGRVRWRSRHHHNGARGYRLAGWTNPRRHASRRSTAAAPRRHRRRDARQHVVLYIRIARYHRAFGGPAREPGAARVARGIVWPHRARRLTPAGPASGALSCFREGAERALKGDDDDAFGGGGGGVPPRRRFREEGARAAALREAERRCSGHRAADGRAPAAHRGPHPARAPPRPAAVPCRVILSPSRTRRSRRASAFSSEVVTLDEHDAVLGVAAAPDGRVITGPGLVRQQRHGVARAHLKLGRIIAAVERAHHRGARAWSRAWRSARSSSRVDRASRGSAESWHRARVSRSCSPSDANLEMRDFDVDWTCSASMALDDDRTVTLKGRVACGHYFNGEVRAAGDQRDAGHTFEARDDDEDDDEYDSRCPFRSAGGGRDARRPAHHQRLERQARQGVGARRTSSTCAGHTGSASRVRGDARRPAHPQRGQDKTVRGGASTAPTRTPSSCTRLRERPRRCPTTSTARRQRDGRRREHRRGQRRRRRPALCFMDHTKAVSAIKRASSSPTASASLAARTTRPPASPPRPRPE